MNKKKWFQRWYDKTSRERIHYNWCVVIIFIFLMLSVAFIFSERIDINCTTGDIDFEAKFNSSKDLTNISINGVDGMACHINLPIAYLGLIK